MLVCEVGFGWIFFFFFSDRGSNSRNNVFPVVLRYSLKAFTSSHDLLPCCSTRQSIIEPGYVVCARWALGQFLVFSFFLSVCLWSPPVMYNRPHDWGAFLLGIRVGLFFAVLEGRAQKHIMVTCLASSMGFGRQSIAFSLGWGEGERDD